LELIWALIMGVARNVAREDRNFRPERNSVVGDRKGKWGEKGVMGIGLKGKTLGLMGFGRLGQSTAKIAQVFGMSILTWSPHLTRERIDESSIPNVELATSKSDLLGRSDILSIQLVLSPSTKHIITKTDLDQVKPGSLLVNTSRGPLIKEKDLIEALKEGAEGKGPLAGAALDVFETEPLEEDSPLRTLDNVLLSPHMGYVTRDGMQSFYENTVENILDWLNGQVKPERLLKERKW